MKFNLGVAFLTLARTEGIMRPMDAALVAIQHEVRTHYGWAYVDDVNSAEGLRRACNEHPEAEALGWSAEGRRATLEALVQRRGGTKRGAGWGGRC